MHAIAFLTQVVHQLVGTFHNARFRSAEIQKFVAHLQTVLLCDVNAVADAKRPAETLYYQEIACDLASGVARP